MIDKEHLEKIISIVGDENVKSDNAHLIALITFKKIFQNYRNQI